MNNNYKNYHLSLTVRNEENTNTNNIDVRNANFTP